MMPWGSTPALAGWAPSPAIPAYTRGHRLAVFRSTAGAAGDAVGVELIARIGAGATTAAHEGHHSEQVPRNTTGSTSRTRMENRTANARGPFVSRIMSLTWRRALQCLEGAWRRSENPDAEAHTAAIQVCARHSQAEAALRLLLRMHSRGVRPNRSAYLAFLISCARVRQWNWALTALREMKVMDLQPGATGYRLAIQACCRGERYKKAESLVVEMRKQDLELDLETYKCMLQGYLERDRNIAAKQLVLDMEVSGIQPDVQTYSFAMRACGRSGDWPSALIFLQAVRWQDAGQDELFACADVIDACARASSWEFALLVLDKAQPAIANQPMGVATDAFVLAAATRACIEGQQEELAEQFKEQKQAALARANAEVLSDVNIIDKEGMPRVPHFQRRPMSPEARERLDWGMNGEPLTLTRKFEHGWRSRKAEHKR